MSADVLAYFDNLKNKICRLFSVAVPIYPMNHDLTLPVDDVLGCCHRLRDDNGNLIGHIITIDEKYITACYYGRNIPHSQYNDDVLAETICHEIAHLYVWEHTKEHAELTTELHNVVRQNLGR